MKVMVTGSGGREHALAWRIAQSVSVERVFVAPGNAGTDGDGKVGNVAIDVMDFDAQIAFARDEQIDLTIIGPEAPLVAGVVDRFKGEGLRCFGPSQKAAQLEGSKSFTKAFLARHRVPTAAYGVFSDADEAIGFAGAMTPPIVVKADGLAAGKGVVVARSLDDASRAIRDMLTDNAFGEAGSTVVVEEFLEGEEASFIVIADGEDYIPFASSQDHKPIFDGDRGPNTGGMGAYSPAPVVTEAVARAINDEVIRPTLAGLAAEGMPYTGFLYAGLMISPDGKPNVIEFNCRFGDPETQPIMARLESDLAELCLAAIGGTLASASISFDDRAALTVVMAAGGYPGDYSKGDVIDGLDLPFEHGKVFHAGTTRRDGRVVTNGGRVLGVTALGETVSAARDRAYEHVGQIRFAGAQYRRDIGHRAIAREQE